jgi:hypothetical protein
MAIDGLAPLPSRQGRPVFSGGKNMRRLAVFCILVVMPLVAEGREPPRGAVHGDDVDRLARRLERDTRELREEVLVVFRDRGSHREMETHLKEIERLAVRIREGADRRERDRYVREMLDKVDEEVRQIESHLRELSRARDLDRRAFDRVRDELADIGRILYRLRREL